jgi:hypothetical protein
MTAGGSRIPPALALRVDRLARRAHAFHRWAHHPLCSRYAAEVVRLGRRTRVCLGCSLTAAGALAGGALGLLLPAAPGAGLLGASVVLLVLLPISIPRSPTGSTGADPLEPFAPTLRQAQGKAERSRPRTAKLLTRFLPVLVAALAVAQALRAPSPARASAAALAALAIGWGILRYRHRGPDRSACEACPEGPPGARCSGLSPIARRERALSRLAGRWIANVIPACSSSRSSTPE